MKSAVKTTKPAATAVVPPAVAPPSPSVDGDVEREKEEGEKEGVHRIVSMRRGRAAGRRRPNYGELPEDDDAMDHDDDDDDDGGGGTSESEQDFRAPDNRYVEDPVESGDDAEPEENDDEEEEEIQEASGSPVRDEPPFRMVGGRRRRS